MSKNFSQWPLFFTIAGAVVGFSTPAQADRTITCESNKERYQFCRVDTRGGVRLNRQFSDARCRTGSTWGYDRDGIWVDRGCRAEFLIRGRDSDYYHGNNDYWGNNSSNVRQTVTCSSEQEKYTNCSVRIDNNDRVGLKRQLSDTGCWQGNTWGYNRNGIWVDRGCRGIFEIRRR